MHSEPDLSFSSRHRPLLTLAGAAAGLAFWCLVEILPDTVSDRWLLAVTASASGLFGSLLLMAGPITLRLAIPASAGLGLLAGTLAYWGAGRFEEVDAFVGTGHPVAALALLIFVSIPFLSALLLPGRPWRDYRTLFDLAWSAVIRLFSAFTFLGLVWLFLWLSDSVLELVGLAFLTDFVDWGAAPFVLSGAVIGLGLAVAGEFGDVLSPGLPLGLLRLILMPAVGVMGLFVIVLPFRELSNAFGTLSATSVLMVMTLAGATLVSAVADRGRDEESTSRILRTGAWSMAILMAVFACLALYGISVRVGQYGWSPLRILASAAGLVVAGYGFGYLSALFRGTRWLSAIRATNVAVALFALILAGASLTPVFNPERLATQAQVSRILSGRAAPGSIDLWSMARDWGVAGRAGLDQLRDEAVADSVLARRIAAYDAASSRFEFENGLPEETRPTLVGRFLRDVPVLPAGGPVPEGVFSQTAPRMLEAWIASCARRTPGGHPGCVIYAGMFAEDSPAPHYVLFTLGEQGFVQVVVLREDSERGSFGPTWVTEDYSRTNSSDLIDALMAGQVDLVPVPLRALRFEGADLLVLP